MSYAEARSKLANLLIKAGYNKKKSLKAVKYPYVESLIFRHTDEFWDSRQKSVRLYEGKQDFIDIKSKNGFALINDKDYNILGDINKGKAFIRVTQENVDGWFEAYQHGAYYYSHPLKMTIKYRHGYPKSEIVDSYKTVGQGEFGIANVAGDYGIKEGEMPLPQGGWLKVELPEV